MKEQAFGMAELEHEQVARVKQIITDYGPRIFTMMFANAMTDYANEQDSPVCAEAAEQLDDVGRLLVNRWGEQGNQK
jgi:hypothetical protein